MAWPINPPASICRGRQWAMSRKVPFARIALILLLLLSTGCSRTDSGQVTFRGYDAHIYHGESSADAQYIRFRSAHGNEEFQIVIPPELPRLVMEYKVTVKSGKVVFKVLDPNGKAILGGYTDSEGALKLYHSLRVPPGTYTVRTEYHHARQGEVRYLIYAYHK